MENARSEEESGDYANTSGHVSAPVHVRKSESGEEKFSCECGRAYSYSLKKNLEQHAHVRQCHMEEKCQNGLSFFIFYFFFFRTLSGTVIFLRAIDLVSHCEKYIVSPGRLGNG